MRDDAISWSSAGLDDEDTRRFRRICIEVMIPVLVAGVVAGLYKLSSSLVAPAPVAVDATQLMQLLQPRPLTPPALRAAPEPKAPARRSTERRSAAPSHASRAPRPATPAPEAAGSAALRQLHAQLAAFGGLSSNLITSNSALSSAPASARGNAQGGAAASLARGAAANSGGLGRGMASASGGSNGINLGQRRGPRLAGGPGGAGGTGGIGLSAGATGVGTQDGFQAHRTLKEVQWIFDRDKSGFAALFNSVARQTAGLESGKIVVNLTIAPNGVVTRCTLVSSSFNNPQLEQLILSRIKILNFGAKQVPDFNYANYPINFLLS